MLRDKFPLFIYTLICMLYPRVSASLGSLHTEGGLNPYSFTALQELVGTCRDKRMIESKCFLQEANPIYIHLRRDKPIPEF